MTALEEIKKGATQEEIAAAWSAWQSRHGGKLGPGPAFVEAINAALALRLPTLESLQRENEEKSAWIKAATTEITKAIGGGSEMFTPHGDAFRVDPAFVASFIQYRRERHAESKKASIQKERELIARAEAAEAEVKRLRDGLLKIRDGYGPNHMSTFCRFWSNEALTSAGGEHHGN